MRPQFSNSLWAAKQRRRAKKIKMADRNPYQASPYMEDHLQDYLSSEVYHGLHNSQSNFTRHMLDLISEMPTRMDLLRPGNYSHHQLAQDFNKMSVVVRDTMIDQVKAYDDLWKDVQQAKMDVKAEQDHWSSFVNQVHQGVGYFDTEDDGIIAKSVLAIGILAIVVLLLCCCCCARSMRDACCGSLCPPVRVVHQGARRYQAPQEV